MVITTGDASCPTVVETLVERGAALTCSFEEEKRALEMSVDWIERMQLTASNTVAVFTDSQSLCNGLLSHTPVLDEIRMRMNRVRAQLTVQWIPGHCNIPGNEIADAAAKLATKCTVGKSSCVTYKSACALVKEITKDPPISHPRTREVYQELSLIREKTVRTRHDQSLLAKIRTGHYIGFRAYRNRIDGKTDPICGLCGEEPHDLEHWLLRCPATAAERWLLFGDRSGRLDVLTSHPTEVVALARRTLLGDP